MSTDNQNNLPVPVIGAKGSKNKGGRESSDTLRSKSVARVLDMVSEGPIRGLVNEKQSVYIDEIAWAREGGVENFEGMSLDIRYGDTSQEPIVGFPSVEREIGDGREILFGNDGGSEVKPEIQINDALVDAVRVTVQIPALAFTQKDGDIVGNSVQIRFEVKNFLTAYSVVLTDTISGKTTAPYERSYRIELPKDPTDPSGNMGFPCKIRASRLTLDGTIIRDQKRSVLSRYTEIIDHKLSYPDTAYIGVTFDSELFKDGVPQRLYHIDGLKMLIPSNYYPFGLEIENLAPKSEDIASASWTKDNLATINLANNIASPEGAESAQVLVPTTFSGPHRARLTNFLTGMFAVIPYSYSVYVKQIDPLCTKIRLTVQRAVDTNNFYVDLDFTTGLGSSGSTDLVANGGVISGWGVDELPDGWYRMWISGYPSATVPATRPEVSLGVAGGFTFAGSGSAAYASVWGLQVNAGASPFQYLRNTGTSRVTGLSDERYYYGTWNGTFKTEWTNNPAWIVYMLLTNPRIGMGQWVDEALVDKWTLYNLAQYCDELVPDGFGGEEPRFVYNGVLRNREDAYTVLQNIASVFRGIIYWGAGSTLVSWDAPKDASILVTPANVIDGMFDYKGVGWKARHSAALVKWNDPSNLYKDAIEVVEDQDLILKYGWKPLETTAIGCTTRGQAYRWGKWILYTEKYETETVTYSASFDHMVKDGTAVMPGDIIKIADPSYAGVRNGGRLLRSTRNFLLYSNQFDNAAWTKASVTVTANALARESLVFEQVSEAAATLSHGVRQQLTLVTADIKPNAVHNYSVYVTQALSNSVKKIYLRVAYFDESVESQIAGITLDMDTGDYVIRSNNLGITNIQIEMVGGTAETRVWRMSYDFTTITPTTETSIRFNVNALDDLDNITYLGDVTRSFYIAQAQLSAGSGVLDYMESVATPRYGVIIDDSVTLLDSIEYTASAVLPTGAVEDRTIVSPAGERTLLQLATPFSAEPLSGAMWVISSSEVEPRTFRVLSVREQERNVVEVTALYHNPDKFAMVEQDLKFETPNFSVLNLKTIDPPTNFGYDEYLFKTVGNSIQTGLLLSWTPPANDGRATFFDIEYKPPSEDWKYFTSTSSVNVTIEGLNQGLYSFRVRCTGSIGNKSDWQTLENIELYGLTQRPPEVTNFNMNAVGDQAYLTWDLVEDSTIGSFVIKTENTVVGAQWGSGIVVLDNIPRTANYVFVPLRFGTYMIKSVSVAGVESLFATLVISDIAGIQNFNALETITCEPTWLGAKVNCEVSIGSLVTTAVGGLYPAEASYELNNVVDLGEVYTNRLTPSINASGQRSGYTMSTWGFLNQVDRLDGGVDGNWSVIIEFATTRSNPVGATDWTDWRPLIIGDSTARAYKFRLRLLSNDTSVQVRVNTFKIVVDMPDRVEGEQAVVVPATVTGLDIVYNNAFKATPAAALTVQNAQTDDVVTLSNETRTGFTVKITNGGSPVTRTINWLAKGYGKQ